MQFRYELDAEYPDNSATVECWTESPGAPAPIPIRSPGYILEAEVLSPLHTLQPMAIKMQQIIWSAAYCPAPIVNVTDVGCMHQPLSIEINDSGARIRGVFGSFLEGSAALDFVDDAGAVIDRVELGPVQRAGLQRSGRNESATGRSGLSMGARGGRARRARGSP